jgi:hypothetical protein
MKKIFILSIIVLVFSMNYIYSEEKKDSKPIEFSIGGGLIHGFDLYLVKKDNSILFGSTIGYYMPNGFYQNIQYVIPISITFYLNQKFGIGFCNSLSFGISFYSGWVFSNLNIIDRLKITNTIGDYYKNISFLIEYGFTNNGKFLFSDLSGYFTTVFFFGPDLFLGAEIRNITKSFKFTIGGTFDFTFMEICLNTFKENYAKDFYHFSFGLECRWQFNYFMKIKDN